MKWTVKAQKISKEFCFSKNVFAYLDMLMAMAWANSVTSVIASVLEMFYNHGLNY
jgi:hypothetical protein